MANEGSPRRVRRETIAPKAPALQLAAVSQGVEKLPFLQARLAYPQVTAMALRRVSALAAARFYVPPAMLARILRNADPVATVSREAVRFEALSACCSAYIRLDLDDAALANVVTRSAGTTNVDFGTKMNEALARVGAHSNLRLEVGSENLSVAHERASASEEKRPLPLRWIKGFAEVQQHMSSMEHRFTLSRIAALRFLRQLPRSKDDRQIWVSLAGEMARISASVGPASVPLRGAHRLAGLEKLGAFATGMAVFHNPRLGSSAWVLKLPGQRLGITLNAEPWRGFPGDGRLLSLLARGNTALDALLRAQLNWQSRIDEPSLARNTGLPLDDIRAGLARLASAGLLGYDLELGSWFHRVLPFDLSRLDQLNPRLQDAAALAEAGAVTLADDKRSGEVRSAGVVHRVTELEGEYRCTCPWFAKHGSMRGPCKHVLAFELVSQDAGRG